MTVNGGTKVVDSQFSMLSELLMRELLKLDSVEAEGEAKVQRRIEVSGIIKEVHFKLYIDGKQWRF